MWGNKTVAKTTAICEVIKLGRKGKRTVVYNTWFNKKKLFKLRHIIRRRKSTNLMLNITENKQKYTEDGIQAKKRNKGKPHIQYNTPKTY